MAEAEQFSLDALAAPAWVVSGRLLDQGGEDRVDRWASLSVEICPVAGDQPLMPPHDCGRGDEPMRARSR